MENQEQKPAKNPSPSTSTARDNEQGAGYDESCEYGGQTYSHGSIVNQGGQDMRCDNGGWVPAKVAPKKQGTATDKGTK